MVTLPYYTYNKKHSSLKSNLPQELVVIHHYFLPISDWCRIRSEAVVRTVPGH